MTVEQKQNEDKKPIESMYHRYGHYEVISPIRMWRHNRRSLNCSDEDRLDELRREVTRILHYKTYTGNKS